MTAERVLSPVTATAYRWRWTALTALLLGEAMNVLDTIIVQVAAPVIHADLGDRCLTFNGSPWPAHCRSPCC